MKLKEILKQLGYFYINSYTKIFIVIKRSNPTFLLFTFLVLLTLPAMVTGQVIYSDIRNSLPEWSLIQKDRWAQIVQYQFGVQGNDYDGADEIGTAPTERLDNLGGHGIAAINAWYPLNRRKDGSRAYKQTLCGEVTLFQSYNNDKFFSDDDINIYLKPSDHFNYLITESRSAEKSIEAEIDIRDVAENIFSGTGSTVPRVKDNMCVYGPWVSDRLHNHKTEIHPAEQLWWREENLGVTTYYCNLICDASRRFMSISELDDRDGSILRPWAEPTLKGVFAIPFEIKLNAKTRYYSILKKSAFNVYPDGADGRFAHHLIYRNDTLLTVFEPWEQNLINVSFEEVGLSDPGNVKGYLVIKTSVGKNNLIDGDRNKTIRQLRKQLVEGSISKEGYQKRYDELLVPGHLLLEIKAYEINPYVGRTQKSFKVTLDKIRCRSADDYGNVEELFGEIWVSGSKLNFGKNKMLWTWLSNPIAPTGGIASCNNHSDQNRKYLWCQGKGKSETLKLRYDQEAIINQSAFLTFEHEGGVIEFFGNINESDSDSGSNYDELGENQQRYILTQEVGNGPYTFILSFYSGTGKERQENSGSWGKYQPQPKEPNLVGTVVEAHFTITPVLEIPPTGPPKIAPTIDGNKN